MADSWPSTLVARQEVSRFSGGAMSGKYLPNLGSAGQGPKGRIKIGTRVTYAVASLIAWFERRSQVVEGW